MLFHDASKQEKNIFKEVTKIFPPIEMLYYFLSLLN